jgi:hypothetical protein
MYPPLVAIREAWQARDWPLLRDRLNELDLSGLSACLWEIAEDELALGFIAGIQASDPDDLLAATTLASAIIAAGWRIRTGYGAEYVSQLQFNAFHDHLRRAEHLLIDITARDPGSAIAWEKRLTTVRGLQLGQNEARRRYDQLAKTNPHHLPAQRQFLQQLCPKWSGSLAAMHAFAEDCAAKAPPGAHNAAVVVDAHYEHRATLEGKTATAYWTGAEVRRSIRAAAERSVLHPQFAQTWGWVRVASEFACVLSEIEDYGAAAHCFRLLGPFVVDNQSYYADPRKVFLGLRAKALAKGGRA